MRAAFPDLDFSIKEQIAEEDKVASRFEWTGKHQGQFLGVPKTGKQARVWGIVSDRLEEGRIKADGCEKIRRGAGGGVREWYRCRHRLFVGREREDGDRCHCEGCGGRDAGSFVHVGGASRQENIELPGAALRSSAIMLMGSGLKSVPMSALKDAIRNVFDIVATANLKIAIKAVPLSEIESTWDNASGKPRVVFTMG